MSDRHNLSQLRQLFAIIKTPPDKIAFEKMIYILSVQFQQINTKLLWWFIVAQQITKTFRFLIYLFPLSVCISLCGLPDMCLSTTNCLFCDEHSLKKSVLYMFHLTLEQQYIKNREQFFTFFSPRMWDVSLYFNSCSSCSKRIWYKYFL